MNEGLLARQFDSIPLGGTLADEGKMKKYRLCLIPFGKAGSEESEIECCDDGAALIKSHTLLANFQAAEVWEGDRLVSRVMRGGSSRSEAHRRLR